MNDAYYPHSIEVEQALLGACLHAGFCPALKPSDFYLMSHMGICQAMMEMTEQRKPLDTLTLYDHLSSTGRLDAAGGASYLTELYEFVPDATNLNEYQRIINEKACARRLVSSCVKAVHKSREMSESGDVYSWIASLQKEFAAFDGTQSQIQQVGIGLRSVISQIDKRLGGTTGLIGIPTGLMDLDKITSGLSPGDLIVVAGRPGMGKTALGTQLALNAAMKGHMVLIFSLEMPIEQVGYRFIAQGSGLNLQNIRTGNISNDQYRGLLESAEDIYNLPIHIDDTSSLTEIDVSQRARRMNPNLIIVDYVGLMRSARKQDRRDLEISEITRSLKILAKDMNVPVVLLSQLNREVEKRPNKRPMLSDLRESGCLEQDSDIVLLLYRDEVYEQTLDNNNLAEIIIAKHRNGQTGTIRVTFMKESTAFKNYGTIY